MKLGLRVGDLALKIGLISGNKYIVKILQLLNDYDDPNKSGAKIQILQIVCEPSITLRYLPGQIFSFPMASLRKLSHPEDLLKELL